MSRRPIMIAVGGDSGTGKTTLCRGLDKIFDCDLFIKKWIEKSLRFGKPCSVPDPREYLLPDWADDDNAAFPNRFLQLSDHFEIALSHFGLVLAAERKRPHTGIDDRLHFSSSSMRSSLRIFL